MYYSNDGIFKTLSISTSDNGEIATINYTLKSNLNGEAFINVIVRDDSSLIGQDSQIFSLMINPVNDSPVFSAVSTRNLLEDVSSNFNISIYDFETILNQQTLSYALINNDSDLFDVSLVSNNTSVTITIDPETDQFGDGSFSFISTDSLGAEVSQNIEVSIVAVNDAPTFSITALHSVLEDSGSYAVNDFILDSNLGPTNENNQTVNQYQLFIDVDDRYLFDVLPSISNDGILSYSLAENQNGSATIRLALQDDGGTDNNGDDYSNLSSFIINIDPVNDVPSINIISDIVTDEDIDVSILVSISDVDIETNSDNLSFNFDLSNDALVDTNISYNDQTAEALITLDLNEHQFGSSIITVNVTDSIGAIDQQSFLLSVNSINDAPEVLLLSDQTTMEDIPIEDLVFSVNDVETASTNLTVTFANTNTTLFPSNSVISTSEGNGYWSMDLTPYTNQYGESTFYIYVSDGDITSEYSFEVKVEDVNDLPIAYSMSIQTDEDVTASITLEAIDLDLDDLYFAVINAENGSVSLDGDIVTYVPEKDFFGQDQFIYRANDGTTYSEVATVNVTVLPVNDLPELLVNDFYVTENASLSFTLDFYDVDSNMLSWDILDLSSGQFNLNLGTILDDGEGGFQQSLVYDTQIDINGVQNSIINVFDQEEYVTFNMNFYINMEDEDADGIRDRDDVFPQDPLLSEFPDRDDTYLTPPGFDDDNIVLWLDSNQPHGDQTNFDHLDTIQTWVDLSGSKYSAVQDTIVYRPKYFNDSDKSFIQFDQAQFMKIVSENNLNFNEMTLVVVFSPDKVSLDQTLISTEYFNNGFQNMISSTDSVFSYRHYFNSVLNTVGLYKVRYDVPNVAISSFSANNQSLKLNGSYDIKLDQQNVVSSQQAIISIASSFDSQSNFYSGGIYEIILYDKALTEYDYKLLTRYFRNKWNVYILDQQLFFE